METRANYVIVGMFTLAALLAAFGFVYWTAGIGEGGDTATLRVRIPGSASGLGRGSAVLFNGVKVGDVTRVFIDVTNPSVAVADAQVDRATPITRSTKADIGIAGLTGQSNIELKGGDVNEPNLLAEAEEKGELAQITADPSAVTNLLQTAQDIFQRADAVLANLESFVVEVRGPLTETVQNAQQFSQALGRNAEGIDTFLANFSKLSETLGSASGQIDATLKAAGDLLNAVEPERVASIVTNLETFTKTLGETADELDSIMTGVDTAVESIAAFTGNAGETLARVDAIVGVVDPEGVRAAMTDIQAASKDARTVAAVAAKVTDTFGSRAEDIDRIISDAGQLTERLNQASARVDGVMAGIDTAVDNVVSFSRQAGATVAKVEGAVAKVDLILEGVDPASVSTSLANIAAASETARTVAADVSKVTASFGERSEDIDRIISDAGQLTQRLNQASARIDSLMAGIDTAVGNVAGFTERAGGTLAKVDGILEGVDAASVRTSLANIAAASETARTAIADVAKVTTQFGERSEDIDQIITDTQQLAARLNEASVRVDGVLAKLDGFLGSGDGGDVIAEATETIRAFREVADTLNARIGTITDGLARFSGQGLRDVEALVTDSRRSINRIEQAITDLERNPQRIITGGDGTVREYDGRKRR